MPEHFKKLLYDLEDYFIVLESTVDSTAIANSIGKLGSLREFSLSAGISRAVTLALELATLLQSLPGRVINISEEGLDLCFQSLDVFTTLILHDSLTDSDRLSDSEFNSFLLRLQSYRSAIASSRAPHL